MMQRFTLLLLVASVALLGAVVPVEATRLVKRETNAHRFARHLPPLAPVKRSRTGTAKRSEVSPQPGVYTGTLQVEDEHGAVLGSVFNDAKGPTGLNLVSNTNPTDSNLLVSFKDGSLLAKGALFSPSYIGAGKAIVFKTPNGKDLNLIEFINVPVEDSAIWTMDLTSRQLTATRTNTDHSEVALALLYNPSENMLCFTENLGAITSSDPLTPVNIYLKQAE